MAGRTLLPIIVLGSLGTAAAGLGVGYGLGQYTVSGIDPFYATARSRPWQPQRQALTSTQTEAAAAEFASLVEGKPSRY